MLRSVGAEHNTASIGLVVALMDGARSVVRGGIWRSVAVALSACSLAIPDLVYVSPRSSTIDRVHKHKLYADHGVTYYWIVDPIEQSIRAYTLGADGLYELVAEARGDVTFSAPPFADLQIDRATPSADPFAGL